MCMQDRDDDGTAASVGVGRRRPWYRRLHSPNDEVEKEWAVNDTVERTRILIMVGIIISSILFELGHHHAMVCYALLCYLLLLPCYCLDGLTLPTCTMEDAAMRAECLFVLCLCVFCVLFWVEKFWREGTKTFAPNQSKIILAPFPFAWKNSLRLRIATHEGCRKENNARWMTEHQYIHV